MKLLLIRREEDKALGARLIARARERGFTVEPYLARNETEARALLANAYDQLVVVWTGNRDWTRRALAGAFTFHDEDKVIVYTPSGVRFTGADAKRALAAHIATHPTEPLRGGGSGDPAAQRG